MHPTDDQIPVFNVIYTESNLAVVQAEVTVFEELEELWEHLRLDPSRSFPPSTYLACCRLRRLPRYKPVTLTVRIPGQWVVQCQVVLNHYILWMILDEVKCHKKWVGWEHILAQDCMHSKVHKWTTHMLSHHSLACLLTTIWVRDSMSILAMIMTSCSLAALNWR